MKKNLLNLVKKRKRNKKMIVFENDSLFVINKLLGDVVHKGSGHDISLLEEFRSYYSNNNINFVNRIDKLTSGLVIGAKNIKTARKVAKEIQSGNIVKKILYFGKWKDRKKMTLLQKIT